MLSILVVDDQPHILRVVKLGLEKQGHVVKTARHGEEAFSILSENNFDAMITDMDMPKMDGRTLCEKVFSELPSANMAIFIITAKTDTQLREWANAQQGVTFLEKPLSLRMLSERLKDIPGSDAGKASAAGL